MKSEFATENPMKQSATTAVSVPVGSRMRLLVIFGVLGVAILALAIGLGVGLGGGSGGSNASAAGAVFSNAPVTVLANVQLEVRAVTPSLAAGLRCDVGRLSGLGATGNDVQITALSLRDGSTVAVSSTDPLNAPAVCPGTTPSVRRLHAASSSTEQPAALRGSGGGIARALTAPSDVVSSTLTVTVPHAQAAAALALGSGSDAALLAAAAAASLSGALEQAMADPTGFAATAAAILADPAAVLTSVPGGSLDPAAVLASLGLGLGTVEASPASQPFPLPVMTALQSGDARNVSGAALRAAFRQEADRLPAVAAAIHDAVWSGEAASGISWDPSHDSVRYSIADTSNTIALAYSNYNYKDSGNANRYTIVAAGQSLGGLGGRFLAFAVNPFPAIASTAASDSFSAGWRTWVRNALKWSLSGQEPGAGVNVTVAHLPGASSYWFQQDAPTRAYFADTLGMRVNAINVCDNDALAGCLARSQLLVIGRQMGRTADDAALSDATDAAAVTATVRRFLARGKPVIYAPYDGDSNDLSRALLLLFGLSPSAEDNYWLDSGLKDASRSSGVPPVGGSSLDTMRAAFDTVTGVTPLTAADYVGCTNVKNTWTGCENAGFSRKLKTGLLALRSALQALDSSGQDLFASTGLTALKLLVLLGDKYRSASDADAGTQPLRYPFRADDYAAFAGAAFADASVLYRRSYGGAQDDLGTLYCPGTYMRAGTCMTRGYDYRSWAATVTYERAVTVTEAVPENERWTTTGLFAVPGRTIQVTRVDNAPCTVRLQLFFQREAVTKAFYVTDDGYSRYERPQFPRSGGILVPADGTTINITAPHGGPLYIAFADLPAAGTAAGSVQLQFSGVTRHAAILDPSSDAQLAAFLTAHASNPIPFFDLRSPGFELHGRKDKMDPNIAGGNEGAADYSQPPPAGGLGALLEDYRYRFVESVYTLAGLKVAGQTLTQSLPAEVQSFCASAGWACTDDSIHRVYSTQHANYDEDAACGSGCSGNPWDASWSVTPTGWGESHELGHNLQRGHLNIAYCPAATANCKNAWSNYANRAGENSNNIFPYHTKWAYVRKYRQQDALAVSDGHMDHFTAFAALQSGVAGLSAPGSGGRVAIFKPDCTVWKDFAAGTPGATAAAETMYWDGAYAADNGVRMSLYLQLPLILHGTTLSDGTVLADGFSIFSLLYAASRLLDRAARDDASWAAGRDALGFSLFPRTGHALYGGGSGDVVTKMVGNDFLVIQLSRITGQDFRPYFNVRGVPYSDLASSQVDALAASGVVRQEVSTDFAVLGEDLPPADLSSVPRVPLDGTTAWPRNSWTPQSCV